MKYIIKWNAGYGETAEVIEAENEEEAQKAAYEAWRADAEDNADYSSEEYTEEVAEDYGL